MLEADRRGRRRSRTAGRSWSARPRPARRSRRSPPPPPSRYDLPEGEEPFLDDTSYYDPPNCTFPFGTHVAIVEVDAETGEVTLKRYVAVDDVGRVINPLIVDGQVHGGIAQGVAQALWEGAIYDENGQLQTREPDGVRASRRPSSSRRSRSTGRRR